MEGTASLATNVWSIGIDVGTASVRTCLTSGDGDCVAVAAGDLSRRHHPENHEFITQSSAEIWSLVKQGISDVTSQHPDAHIGGIGVDATCSLVVLKKDGQKLVPYPVDYGFQTADQNVVLWMDHRCDSEAKQLNAICEKEPFMSKIGGSFLPEMGVPKLKYLVDRIPQRDLADLVFMELHDFVSIMLITNGELAAYQKYTVDPEDYNAGAEIALDGSVKGWSKRMFALFGLQQLTVENFASIGRPELSNDSGRCPLPFAGARIGTVSVSLRQQLSLKPAGPIYVGHGVIDCYAGWIATVKEVDNTLSMVAGTSTCYLVASAAEMQVVPGVWGPFDNFVRGHFISEGGQSATGSLIEHLFRSHPAFPELEKSKQPEETVFDALDRIVDHLAAESGVPIANYLVRHKFTYGNIFGNRTPYAEPQMSGAYIGETGDLSVKDLALKYLATLEFLALETRQIVETLAKGGYTFDQISISGSQSYNTRLLDMIEVATGKRVVCGGSQSPTYTVVKGASMIGLAAAHGIAVTDVMGALNVDQPLASGKSHRPELKAVLDAKFRIMVDMAEAQIRYRSLMDQVTH